MWPFWDLIFITANFSGCLVTNGGLELVYEHPPGVLAAVELPHQGAEAQVGRAHVLCSAVKRSIRFTIGFKILLRHYA